MNFIKQTLFVALLFISNGLFAQHWVTNIDEAKQMAKADNKKVVIVFSGSDWCGPCIKLDKKIWSSEAFQQIAEKDFVMVHADFPKSRKNRLSPEQMKHNEALAEKYNDQGYFPYVVVLSPNGKKLGAMGYEDVSPTTYANKLNSLK